MVPVNEGCLFDYEYDSDGESDYELVSKLETQTVVAFIQAEW